ncbi:katanin p80 WD40 repeat-containing subunit B1 isoform X2 [Hydra vulgaris]|uniref:katanin p80 WD40 repeat-containing subunit B1 isoform X2 n=1 Tax=Hydra vulgaris TaxID=6087 RepID=UPI001F5E3FCE|nr:katanin p80 WD40 repeat-containing subunit B1 isoform X2 [Hydra vulgaris]
MSNPKRSWKLQEFVAHSANVTCLAMGPASGRVMVTGGEDKKVNMWAVGKPNVILSLSGHTSTVECVQFNNSEELVCAGSQSGSLKIWDLEAAKIVRTLTGHKANIKCLDFHPYGEFVASGSLDTTVRLWDVRRKGCIVSYKGHTNAINHLKFSPDGRWVISAGEDGMVKLWDLNAGKLLADFILHAGPVNCVEFHPREFLVATGSSDRTVKFWDLETFGLVSSTDVEASAVRTICFHPDGSCLFSGGLDSLRVYAWEPSCCYDAQTLGWGKVAGMAFSTNQLIGASFQSTNVSVWVANMLDLEEIISRSAMQPPFEKIDVKEKEPVKHVESVLDKKQSPQRKSFNTRPKTSSTKPKPSKDSQVLPDAVVQKINDPNINYEAVFNPLSALSRSPKLNKKNVQPFAVPNEDPQSSGQVDPLEKLPPPVKQSAPMVVPVQLPPKQPVSYMPINRHQALIEPSQQTYVVTNAEASNAPSTYYPQQLPSNDYPIQYQHQPRVSQPIRKQSAQQGPALIKEMDNLNLDNFSQVEESSKLMKNEEDNTLSILERNHTSLCQILQARLQNLMLISRLWTDGDIKAAVETAGSMADQSVFVDLMNVLAFKQSLWNLDLCGVVLPLIKKLFSSNYECYIQTASSSLKLILSNFSQLIKSTLSTPPGALGVDLSREERYNKCDKCYKQLLLIKNVVSERTTTSGRIGVICRELTIALRIIDM